VKQQNKTRYEKKKTTNSVNLSNEVLF